GIGNGKKRLLARERLPDDSGEEPRCGLVRLSRPDTNGRQPDTDSVEESAPRVVGEQELANRLLRSIRGQRREMKFVGDRGREGRAIDGNGRGEDDLRHISCRTYGLEQRPGSV